MTHWSLASFDRSASKLLAVPNTSIHSTLTARRSFHRGLRHDGHTPLEQGFSSTVHFIPLVILLCFDIIYFHSVFTKFHSLNLSFYTSLSFSLLIISFVSLFFNCLRQTKTNKTNELYFIPITVHRKTWSSIMVDNIKVEKHW